MTKAPTDQVQQWAAEAGFEVNKYGFGIPQRHLVDGPVDAPWLKDAIEEIAARAYAAGQAAERTNMPPPPMIVDASKIDISELEKMMKRAGPPDALVAVPERPDDIEAAVAAERESIIAQLLALGALEDGSFIAAIRARGEKGGE